MSGEQRLGRPAVILDPCIDEQPRIGQPVFDPHIVDGRKSRKLQFQRRSIWFNIGPSRLYCPLAAVSLPPLGRRLIRLQSVALWGC